MASLGLSGSPIGIGGGGGAIAIDPDNAATMMELEYGGSIEAEVAGAIAAVGATLSLDATQQPHQISMDSPEVADFTHLNQQQQGVQGPPPPTTTTFDHKRKQVSHRQAMGGSGGVGIISDEGGSEVEYAPHPHYHQQHQQYREEAVALAKRQRTDEPPRHHQPAQAQTSTSHQQQGHSQPRSSPESHPHGHRSRSRHRHGHGSRRSRRSDGSQSGSPSGTGTSSGGDSRSRSRASRGTDSQGSGSYSSGSGSDSCSRSDDEDAAEARRQRRNEQARSFEHGDPLGQNDPLMDADFDGAVAPSETGEPLFSCQTAQSDTLVQLLSSLVLDKDQRVKLSIGAAGIKVVAEHEKSRTICAKAYLKKSIFSEYAVNPTRLLTREAQQRPFEYSCVVQLPLLLSCLQLFGSGTSGAGAATIIPVVHIEIPYVDHDISIILDGSDGTGHNMETRCQVKTIDQSMARTIGEGFQFGPDKWLGCVINSSALRQAFSELDLADAEHLEIRVDLRKIPREPDQVALYMAVKGNGGLQVDVELLREPVHNVFHENNIDLPLGRPFRITYKLASLRPCIKALAKASMSNFRINAQGLLSIQHIINPMSKASTGANWVEYFAVALNPPDDEQEPEGPPAEEQQAVHMEDDSQPQHHHSQQQHHSQQHSQHSHHSQQHSQHSM